MQSLLPAGAEIVVRQQRWRIRRVFRHGAVTEVDVGAATFFMPFDRIVAVAPGRRLRRVRRQKWRALVAHACATTERFDLPLAAQTAAIDLLSHQLEPCLASLAGVRRLLIADDVGLGKTIEAGLIVAERLRRADARRALVIAPATLCEQWRRELKTRFDLDATIVDRDSLRQMAVDLPRDVNPWSLDGVFLTSIDFIKQPHVLAAMPAAPWDIVVIDEAHTISGDSARHDAANDVGAAARHIVLLTATPHSGDEGAARRLERLGGVGDADELVVFRRMRLDIGPGPLRRIRRVRVTPTSAEAATLDLLGRFDRIARTAASRDTRDATELLLSMLNKRALSTFGALVLSIERRLLFLEGHDVPADANQLAFQFGDEDNDALSVRIGLPADRERNWLKRLRVVAAHAARVESKLLRLVTLIARTSEPAIVFTEFRDSLAIVERTLSSVAAVSVAHGALPPPMLAQAIDHFQSGRSRVLVATDVASQGLNLHHRCRWVIHLDRPWNPMRLEQRAGRVDRLGQVRDVHLTELLTSHAREFELAERVGRRAQAAATSEWLRPCDRWARRARAAARVLNARRRLAAAWRGPQGIARPVCSRRTTPAPDAPRCSWHCRSSFTLARGASGADIVRLFSIAIRDRDGRVRDELLSCGDADRAVAARMRRLARLAGERAAQSAGTWRDVSRHVPAQLTLPGAHARSDDRSTSAPEHPRTSAPAHAFTSTTRLIARLAGEK